MLFPWKGIFLFVAIAVTGNLTCYGQNGFYIFRNINTSDGVASDIIMGITQDDKGFMWIATTNGLQKYDGNAFTTYHHDPYDSQSISSDNAGFLLKDRENNIWISMTFLGFNIFNTSTAKSTRVSAFKDSSLRNLDYSTSACMDPKGNIWLISISTIAKYDVQRHQLVSYDHLLPKNITIGMTKSILCDPHTGNLWINSFGYGVCMLDPKKIYCIAKPSTRRIFLFLVWINQVRFILIRKITFGSILIQGSCTGIMSLPIRSGSFFSKTSYKTRRGKGQMSI